MNEAEEKAFREGVAARRMGRWANPYYMIDKALADVFDAGWWTAQEEDSK